MSLDTPLSSAASHCASFSSTSGRSTGSSVWSTVLYTLAMSARLPVSWRKYSALAYTRMAVAGTSTPSSRKYLISRSRRTSMGSKLTLMSGSPPSSARVSSGRRSLSSPVASTRRRQSLMVSRSYSPMAAITVEYVRVMSLAASDSITTWPSERSLAMGSSMRAASPRHHATVPECGAAFELSAGASLPRAKSSLTVRRSAPYARTRSACFLWRSAAMISRSSSPSKLSSSEKVMATVEQSSKALTMTLPRRRSSSLITQRAS